MSCQMAAVNVVVVLCTTTASSLHRPHVFRHMSPLAAPHAPPRDADGSRVFEQRLDLRELERHLHGGRAVSPSAEPARRDVLEVERETLLPGRYGLYLRDGEGDLFGSAEIRILGQRRELGTVVLPHSWGPKAPESSRAS